MDPLFLFLLSVPVALLITWRLLTGPIKHHRREQRASESRAVRAPARALETHGNYEAQRLRICNNPCKAALKLRDQAFLAGDAPVLPLRDCDRPGACHCEYSLHRDRRGGHDRRYPAEDIVPSEDIMLPTAIATAEERRERRERRARKKQKSYADIY